MKIIVASFLFLTSTSAMGQLDPNESKGKETDSIGKSIASKEFNSVLRWAQPLKLRRSSLESDALEREDEIFANSRIKSGKKSGKRANSSQEKSEN